MARKKDVVKKIDVKTKSTGAPLPLVQEDQPAPPGFYLIPAPDSLTEVAQAIQRSTQAPLVMVSLSWEEAPNIAPDYYNVEWDEDSSFPNVSRARASSTTATISGLKANGVTYYFRVQAVAGGIYSPFSDTLTVVTITDDTPPPDVTGTVADFYNSDLVITYDIPVSEILKDVKIEIYNFAHTILYDTIYTTQETYIWTAERNIAVTGGTPLTSVSIDIHTRSWTNELSTPGENVTTTAAIPGTPTGYASNWIADNGTADEDFVTTWLGATNANDYELTIDGNTFITKDLRFTYRYDRNVTDHRPTLASGDPSFIWLLKARDKLGQSSLPVNVTVTNAAPPSGVMNMTVTPGFSTLGITVALLGNIIVQDFDHYEYALVSGATVFQRYNSPDGVTIMQVSEPGSYVPTVTMVDKFSQRGPTLSGAIQVMDVLTIAQLRAETTYTDSLGASSPALDIFKDGDALSLKPYPAVASGVYNWIEARRPFIDRHRTTTFNAVHTGATLGYMEYNDGTTSVYYSGPVTTSAVGTKILTRYATEALAKTNRIRLDLLSSTRIDLPNLQEARTIRIYFSNYVFTTFVYEYYPRRLVQTDDLEAETITSINVAALGINADRIFATSLSAFTASMGTLHIDSLLDIQTSGIIWQGTGSGTLLQNATTPTSFSATGLKIFNSSGVGKLSTYNTGVEQITLDTDGKFKCAAGGIVMDSTGMHILADGSNYIDWHNGAGVYRAIINAQLIPVSATPARNFLTLTTGYSRDVEAGVRLQAFSVGGSADDSTLTINTNTDGGHAAFHGGSAYKGVAIGQNDAPTRNLTIYDDSGYISWNTAAATEKWVMGLEVSSSNRWVLYNTAIGSYGLIVDASNNTFSTNGDFNANSRILQTITTANTSSAYVVQIFTHRSSGTPAANFGSDFYTYLHSSNNTDREALLTRVIWATATDGSRKARLDYHIFDTTSRHVLRMEASGSAAMIGFLGNAAVVRQTAAAAATDLATVITLANSLRTALNNLGLTA